MFDTKELFLQINRLKRENRVFTNSFFLSSDLKRLAQQEDSLLTYSDRAIALLYNDNGVSRLNFYLYELKDAGELKCLLDDIGRTAVILDCVGNRDYVDSLEQALTTNGFASYAHLSRWRSKSIRLFSELPAADETLRAASPNDIPEIMAIVCDVLDPFVGHLPDERKLLDLINKNLVFCAAQHKKIIAAVCLENVGKLGIYIFIDAVAKAYQSSGIGIWLLQFALSQYRDRRMFTSWTEDSNKASNRMHRMLGMKYDGLKDTVLLYQ